MGITLNVQIQKIVCIGAGYVGGKLRVYAQRFTKDKFQDPLGENFYLENTTSKNVK